MAMIKEDECPEGLPGWLATFGDLMSLLLTFFVLLLSFSTMDVTSFQHAMGALQGALGVLSGEPQLSLPIRQSMPKTEGNLSQAEMMNKAGKDLQHTIEEAGLQGDVHLEESTSGIIIRISDKLFFESADANVLESASVVLNAVGKAISQMPNNVNIQGHTDNRTTNTENFASNWELSGMRALSVGRYFIDIWNISPKRISITGYSEYRPLVPNNSDLNMGKNRRVEIHIRYMNERGITPSAIYSRVEKQGISVDGREMPLPDPVEP
ncbi:MAG: flagellar motor protein MotB [Candidatus Latescibacterota bacterium]|nr:flagellar motor protein MotB [Candidatus Latescibacterota bacterium]